MAKKCKEKGEGRIGDTVKPFDAADRRHLAVPEGSGRFACLVRQKGSKMFSLPSPSFLPGRQICSDQSITLDGVVT
jgi:hypothetical protein